MWRGCWAARMLLRCCACRCIAHEGMVHSTAAAGRPANVLPRAAGRAGALRGSQPRRAEAARAEPLTPGRAAPRRWTGRPGRRPRWPPSAWGRPARGGSVRGVRHGRLGELAAMARPVQRHGEQPAAAARHNSASMRTSSRRPAAAADSRAAGPFAAQLRGHAAVPADCARAEPPKGRWCWPERSLIHRQALAATHGGRGLGLGGEERRQRGILQADAGHSGGGGDGLRLDHCDTSRIARSQPAVAHARARGGLALPGAAPRGASARPAPRCDAPAALRSVLGDLTWLDSGAKALACACWRPAAA